jgi:peroxin-5
VPNTAGPSAVSSPSIDAILLFCPPINFLVAHTHPQAFRRSGKPQSRGTASTPAGPFDLSALQRQLSPAQAAPQIPSQTYSPLQQSASSSWAASFDPQNQAIRPIANTSSQANHAWHDDYAQYQQMPQRPLQSPPEAAPWQRASPQPFMPRPAFQPHYGHGQAGFHQSQPFFPPQDMPYQQYPQQISPFAQTSQSTTHVPQEQIPEQQQHPGQAPDFSSAEPLTEPQDLLSRTANSLITDLDNSNILNDNPKLAQSQFMQLMRGLGGGAVVVQEGEVTDNAEQIGASATFMPRATDTSAGTADWASAFLSDAIAGPSSQTNITAAQPRIRTRGAEGGGRYHNVQFPDQDSILMPSDSVHSQSQAQGQEENYNQEDSATRQRRKSVHFNENDISQPSYSSSSVPNNLSEALSHQASIPGATSQWQESGLDDPDGEFDMESFMQFNGPMSLKPSQDSRIGVGDMEGWGELQSDWEAHERSEARLAASTTTRAMGNVLGQDGGEMYLFQARNPYTEMEGDVDMGRQSPTHQVSAVIQWPSSTSVPTQREGAVNIQRRTSVPDFVWERPVHPPALC